MAENTQPTVEDLKAPLLAAVGAADLALATVNEIVASLRERAEEARTDANARVEEGRARLTKLQEELPGQVRNCARSSAPKSCARPPRPTPRTLRTPTTSWSSVARPRWSACAPSRPSRAFVSASRTCVSVSRTTPSRSPR